MSLSSISSASAAATSASASASVSVSLADHVCQCVQASGLWSSLHVPGGNRAIEASSCGLDAATQCIVWDNRWSFSDDVIVCLQYHAEQGACTVLAKTRRKDASLVTKRVALASIGDCIADILIRQLLATEEMGCAERVARDVCQRCEARVATLLMQSNDASWFTDVLPADPRSREELSELGEFAC